MFSPRPPDPAPPNPIASPIQPTSACRARIEQSQLSFTELCGRRAVADGELAVRASCCWPCRAPQKLGLGLGLDRDGHLAATRWGRGFSRNSKHHHSRIAGLTILIFSHHHRHEAPPPPSPPYKHAPTPMPRPLPPRSPPSSSSASAACRRSLVSPRLVAFCLSGTLKQETTNAPLNYSARTFPGIVIATAPTKKIWRQLRLLLCGPGVQALTGSFTVMVSPVCTVWPTSRPRSWSSMSSPDLPRDWAMINTMQVRVWRQGHVHEPRGWPSRCRALRF